MKKNQKYLKFMGLMVFIFSMLVTFSSCSKLIDAISEAIDETDESSSKVVYYFKISKATKKAIRNMDVLVESQNNTELNSIWRNFKIALDLYSKDINKNSSRFTKQTSKLSAKIIDTNTDIMPTYNKLLKCIEKDASKRKTKKK